MKCTVCKSELEPQFKFCPNCGTLVLDAVNAPEPDYDFANYPDGFDPKLYGLEN